MSGNVGCQTTSQHMPSPEVLIRRAATSDRVPLFRMLELYQHDLSDIWDQDIDGNGEYGYALDRYWSSEQCHPFIATVNGRYAGFSLIDQAVKVGTEGHWVDQFFVLKKYRQLGVGSTLALGSFSALPGHWEVGQMLANQVAQHFWRKVVSQYTAGAFVEHKLTGGRWEGYVQCFTNSATK